MDKLVEIKLWITALFSAIALKMGEAYVPVLIMAGASVLDYITGLMAAKYRDQKIDTDIAARGIIKKVSMWLLVVVGAVIDWLLGYTGFNIPIPSPVAIIVAVWIIANELISILENLHDVDVPMPEYLLRLAEMIRTSAKLQVPETTEKTEEKEHV